MAESSFETGVQRALGIGKQLRLVLARLDGNGFPIMIIALAGRRIDKADSKDPRFPLRNVERVARGLSMACWLSNGATIIVGSAACGADLVALTEAGKLGLRRKIMLPFDRATFRQEFGGGSPG